MKNTWYIIFVLIGWGMGVASCHYSLDHNFRQNYSEVNEGIYTEGKRTPYFKVHLKNGDVGMMQKWDLNVAKDTIKGWGTLYDFNRRKEFEGSLSFPVDEIAIIETNQLETIKSRDKGRIAALSILTGANLALDIVCITNPKACFGSCPTFYINRQEKIHSAHAEGFSSCISPCLEERDLDALNHTTSSGTFDLYMKNEAFETHVVNELFLHAIPKSEGQFVFHDEDNRYYLSEEVYTPDRAYVGEKDIKHDLIKMDEYEYFSSTDSTDLATKEEIIIEFDQVHQEDLGVILGFRQTMLTTFLLYSGLSYMGDEVGRHFAKIETNPRAKAVLKNPFKKLGGIRLSIWDRIDQKWAFVDEIYETGPIAKNLTVVPILEHASHGGGIRVKVELTKGLWRLDQIGLAGISAIETPVPTYPSYIETFDGEDYCVGDINRDDENYLISFPGNEFRFRFDLPKISDQQEYELFLSSKGYYLEWMRSDWLRGKDLSKLRKMLRGDAETWRALAMEFKEMEDEMESVFWNSKYSDTQ